MAPTMVRRESKARSSQRNTHSSGHQNLSTQRRAPERHKNRNYLSWDQLSKRRSGGNRKECLFSENTNDTRRHGYDRPRKRHQRTGISDTRCIPWRRLSAMTHSKGEAAHKSTQQKDRGTRRNEAVGVPIMDQEPIQSRTYATCATRTQLDTMRATQDRVKQT